MVDLRPQQKLKIQTDLVKADFRHPPIDYEERDRKSRRLGVAGEDLAFAYERAELIAPAGGV